MASEVRLTAPVGTVDAGVVADVDEVGVVQVRARTWSLDWWIGAEDRWHHPADEPTVRQRSLAEAPVLETAMRVPGGDVLQRCFAIQAGSGPAVVVEVENCSAVPVALAFVVCPRTSRGPGSITEIDGDGAVIRVNGEVAAILDRAPARVVQGRSADVAPRLAAADDRPVLVREVDDGGDLEVALVVPLTHTATIRILLPIVAPISRTRAALRRAPRDPLDGMRNDGGRWVAPDADAVGRGWTAHSEAMVRATLPAPGWENALAWADRVLCIAGPDEVAAALDPRARRPIGPPSSVRLAEVCEAMARSGSVEALDPIALALAAAQGVRGGIRLGDRTDATVALVHAAAVVLAGPVGSDRAELLIGPVAKAVHRLDKRGADGLDRSAAMGLQRLAPALDAVGQPDVATAAREVATRLGSAGSPGSTRDGTDGWGDGSLGRMLAIRALVVAGHDDALSALDEHIAPRPTSGVADAIDPADRHIGFDAAEVAARQNAILDVLVAESAVGLDLLPGWSSAWFGQPLEVHNLRTSWGTVGFGLRWHDDRPALFCEIEPHPGSDPDKPPIISVSGVDRGWSALGWGGDTLLPPVEGSIPTPAGVTVQVAAPIRRRG